MKKLLAVSAVALAGLNLRADVWQDCTAWYMGGSETVGAFANGDMTDLRHAAIADSPTHGGTTRGNATGISNLCESVYSAASGRTFANQRTIYLAQRETASGTYSVYENGVTLPFAATNNNYTLLMRVKLDEAQPHNKDFVYIADLGYSGSNPKHAFAIRYLPGTEQIGFLYNAGNNSSYFSPTNDVCTTLRGKWLELSVSLAWLSQTSDGKDSCRMRIGVAAEGIERKYHSKDFSFPKGQAVPKDGKMYLAGTTGYGGASPKCNPARGSYQMVSYWERVLTDNEILEAFKLLGPDGTADRKPALLKVGDSAWGADVFGTAIDGSSATPSLDLQDLAKIPLQIAAEQTLNLPFTVPVTCTNLAQIVRLSAADGSAETCVQVKVDDQDVGVVDIVPGKTAYVRCEAALFTEGAHTLTLTRSDAGAGLIKLTGVEISGSWRVGWIDKLVSEFGGDSSKKTHVVADLTTNDWSTLRSTVKATYHLELVTDIAPADAEKRKILLRVKPQAGGYPAQSYDFVVLANGAEVFRRTISPIKPYDDGRSAMVAVPFRPESLLAGRNVFTFKTEINEALDPNPASTWLRLDYFELEVGKEPTGGMLILR